MSVECASCGQVIPSGQFRCGSCGAVQPRASFDDYGGMSELSVEPARPPSQELTPLPLGSQAVRVGSDATQTGAFRPVQTNGERATRSDQASASHPEGERREANEDDGAREPAVPRGTFASVVPESDAEEEPPRVVAPAAPEPRDSFAKQANKPGTNNQPATQRIKSVRPPVRPPYLASEILREDLTPSDPGRKHLDLILHIAPALGVVAVLSSGLHRVATWVSLGVLAAMFLLTRFELDHVLQSALVAGLGGLTLAAAATARVILGGGSDGPMLAAAATLLPAALLFRAWYRAAYTARVLVALALVLGLTWATWTSHSDLLALEFDWASWVPALAWYVYCLLCLLSLLAFMNEETTGGCDVWALGLWVWYGLYACSRFALEGGLAGPALEPNLQTLGLVEPALAAPTSVAFAQLFARILVSRSAR
jgi:hypothetical protein